MNLTDLFPSGEEFHKLTHGEVDTPKQMDERSHRMKYLFDQMVRCYDECGPLLPMIPRHLEIANACALLAMIDKALEESTGKVQ